MAASVPVGSQRREARGRRRFVLSQRRRIAPGGAIDSTHGMVQTHPTPTSCEPPLPETVMARLAVFASLFTRPTWSNVSWLVAGAILAPGPRTVAAGARH